jgi:site-specific DNA-methyltransferase (adenine-specific)
MIVHSDPYCEVHHADCLDADAVHQAMGKLRADALIFDAPFSAKTHAGHASFCTNDAAVGRRGIEYDAFSAEQIATFCNLWLPLCNGWIVSITDDTLAPLWRAEFDRAGLYTFAALPLVEIGGRVRLSGDGPSSWTCLIIVARPRTSKFVKWGTLPGAYVQNAERKLVVGGKPFRSMCAIVGDYSRRGDLIVDPFAGGGTTLAAAKHMGRSSMGFDRSELHAKLTAKRVAKTREQLTLFEPSTQPAMMQQGLFK